MSPGVLSAQSNFTVKTVVKTAEEKHIFGAIIENVNLENISDSDVQALSDAVWTHKVVIVKGQKHIHPSKQWELVTRFDPKAPLVHSHGDITTFNAKGGLLSKGRDVVAIPGVENVRVIGNGYQGEDHYGIINKIIKRPLSHDWQDATLSDEDFEAGHTRFQRWHFDAPLYARDPAWFTTLRCVKRPTSPEVVIHWDDGSGYTMKSEPGLTAFFSCVQMYNLMTDEEKQIADHSWVEYAPHPYKWMGECKGKANGLGVVSQGRELSLEKLGSYDEASVKKYPMVWVNPITGEKAFMVHGICARKIFRRSNVDQKPEVIDDVVQIRNWLRPIQERVLKPEYIMLPKVEEGDIVMWANYQMFHTAVDYPDNLGPRTMYQANIGASSGPVGPVPIPVAA
ncbi:putative dioxygenase C576.01c-like protein 2 [Colletotrichum chlorophyti]|uniref:Putative dioxygenase C576.01c-like protein 2 n=1 Tax=Colletotrichum chlorophyti TaxID=708187 RepID=A0A1Q8S288_9PEZI|nr:putative dioxygenase C576.01c-like protein 2 [Colletotrichum chlorophyti]